MEGMRGSMGRVRAAEERGISVDMLRALRVLVLGEERIGSVILVEC